MPEWVHPDVEAAINADPEIRPEAKGLFTAAVSRAVQASADPDLIRRTIDACKAGDGSRYLTPSNPPAPEPGSLAAIAERFKAAQGPYPQLGLGPLANPTTYTPEQRRAPAQPAQRASNQAGGSLDEVAAAYRARRDQYPSIGFRPVDPPKKST